MRVFVVGATGVLGRALLPLLIQKGHRVRVLARKPENVPEAGQAAVEVQQGDLLAPDIGKQLPDLLAGCDAALHLATAIPRDPGKPGAWDLTARLRTEGTRLLLQSALAAGVRQYIQQSITMAYPDGGDSWLTEETPLSAMPERLERNQPVIAMEDMIRAISPDQLAWTILRGGNFVGPGTTQDDQIAQLRAERLVVPGDGRNYISLVNVADMATAIVAALEEAPAGSIFNIVDEPIRNGDYLDRLAALAGASRPPRRPEQPMQPSWRCSNQAARATLHWTPTHGIWPTPQQLAT